MRGGSSRNSEGGKSITSEDTVLLEKRGKVHVFTLNQPERMNAFEQATMEKMHSSRLHH